MNKRRWIPISVVATWLAIRSQLTEAKRLAVNVYRNLTSHSTAMVADPLGRRAPENTQLALHAA
jgi:hypothetical protein